MWFWNWFGLRRQHSEAAHSPSECDFSSEPENAELIDLNLEGPEDCFLQQFPACGEFWGGHGYQLHFRWAFSPEEASEYFPALRTGRVSDPENI